MAAKLAEHGLATIAINAVGQGGGPLGTLAVVKMDTSTVTLPAGGRNVDRNGNGVFDSPLAPYRRVSTRPRIARMRLFSLATASGKP